MSDDNPLKEETDRIKRLLDEINLEVYKLEPLLVRLIVSSIHLKELLKENANDQNLRQTD